MSSNFDSLLLQNSDNKIFSNKDFKIVSKKKPSQKMLKNLIFSFNICRNVKSNAIVLIKNDTTIGIGSGQPSRIDSCKLAIDKMNKFQKIDFKLNTVETERYIKLPKFSDRMSMFIADKFFNEYIRRTIWRNITY